MECYDAGVETLFSVDALRFLQEQHAVASFEAALVEVASARPEVVLKSLPRLFRSHGQSQIKHRSSLYGQGSKQTAGSTTEQARSAVMTFFTVCESILDRIPESEDVWKTRGSLLLVLDEESLINTADERTMSVLRRIGEAGIASIASAKRGNAE